MASLFEEIGGTYTLGADGMYYPVLEFPEEEAPQYGKYGKCAMLTSGSIRKHIIPDCC